MNGRRLPCAASFPLSDPGCRATRLLLSVLTLRFIAESVSGCTEEEGTKPACVLRGLFSYDLVVEKIYRNWLKIFNRFLLLSLKKRW